jgi:hypothetical protein
MKTEPVKCEFCKAEISSEACQLASYKTFINGVERVFCCQQCFKRYEQEKKK